MTTSLNETSFLISQTLYGESIGVGILKKLKDSIGCMSSSTDQLIILEGLEKQIKDEASHALFYSDLLKKGSYGAKDEVSDLWKDIMMFIQAEPDPFGVVCGIHLLIEPFNHLVVKDLILPSLSKEDQVGINQLINEETEHIDLGIRLIHFFKSHSPLKKDELIKKFQRYARYFISKQAKGIFCCRTQNLIQISNHTKDEFLESINSSRNLLIS